MIKGVQFFARLREKVYYNTLMLFSLTFSSNYLLFIRPYQ